MGSYITKTDIIEAIPQDLLIQLTDDEGLGSVNDSRVDAAIEDAEGEVNGYLSTRYSTPLSPAPAAVKKFTVDIAVYNLFARRLGAPEDKETRYRNAIKFFENASKGLVSLGADAPEPENSSVDFRSGTRAFTRGKMEGF